MGGMASVQTTPSSIPSQCAKIMLAMLFFMHFSGFIVLSSAYLKDPNGLNTCGVHRYRSWSVLGVVDLNLSKAGAA